MSEDRRNHILNASVIAFSHHGYRKTSLEDVAREAGISRQGLYLHFSSKDELFSATIDYALSMQLEAAEKALSNGSSILSSLLKACDEWAGRHIGQGTSDADDLAASSTAISGDLMKQFTARFEALLTSAISSSTMMASLKNNGLTSCDVAKTIYLLTAGIKTTSRTREEFRQSLASALSVLIAPHLKERK
jgi:AcrR family transcriptional regulator